MNRRRVPPLPPFDVIHDLLTADRKDDAVLYYIRETDFVLPSEPELARFEPGPVCTVLLDRNLPWCVAPRPLAERCLRLIREGKLRLEARGFVPNDPAVLTAEKALLLPFGGMPLSGLPDARRQPPNGYRHPHRAIAFLRPARAKGRLGGHSAAAQ